MCTFQQMNTESWTLIYVRFGFGSKMGKFRYICTELWPLIYIKISFSGSILSIHNDKFSSNFV